MRRSFRLPRVYPITDTQISGLAHADQVALFAEAGATLVQLREKRASAAEFYAAAKAALAVAAERGVQLIVNDRVDIALAIAASGVHLGQDDLPPEAARRLLGDEAVLGYSTHSVSQALEAAALPIDYLAIGPIFSTRTKENPDPVVGLEGLRTVRDAIGRLPLVAIGGITPANAIDVIRAGADSVAMISGLWDEGSVVSSAFRPPLPPAEA
jgi:thiamine-phosphate pyrophosphorylase